MPKMFFIITIALPDGSKWNDWMFLNRDREGEWESRCPLLGTRAKGSIEMVSTFSTDGIYLKEDTDEKLWTGSYGTRVVGLMRNIATRSLQDVGDTGTGKLYGGQLVKLYPLPLEFKWECAPAPAGRVPTWIGGREPRSA